MMKRLLLTTCVLLTLLASGGQVPACAVNACGDSDFNAQNNNPADLGDIAKGIDWMAKGNCNAPSARCYFTTQTYQHTCFEIPSLALRQGESANDLLATAVDAIVRGDKYLAVATVALAFCHDRDFQNTVNRDKKLVYEYIRTNYVAGWDDVTGFGIHSQAFKVGQEYSDNPSDPNHGLEDCVGVDKMSRIAVPEGLQMTVCDHGSGSPFMERGCQTFGPGRHDLRNAHPRFDDLASYVKASRR